MHITSGTVAFPVASFVWLLVLPLIVLAVWQCMGVALSVVAIRRMRILSPDPTAGEARRVAALYLTCDDFNANACESLTRQTGVDVRVFILDDSADEARRAEVDAWVAGRHGVHVIRRGGRAGFKAGNINHWLRTCGGAAEFPFALAVDADEVVPPDFTSRLLAAIEPTGAAFAQGCHEACPAVTPFQKLLGLHVAAVWRYVTPARNLIGLPWMLGHGVLFRVAAIEEVGGFPEIVSEDLALTIALAERGRTGVAVPDATAWEEFPPTCAVYWRRLRRWITADTELVRTFLPRLWRSALPVLPKLDLTLRELRLPLLACGWLIPVALTILALAGVGPTIHLPASFWLVLLPLLLPHLTVWMLPRGTWRRCTKHSVLMPFLGLAGLGLYVPAVIEGLRGNGTFHPTGSLSEAGKVGCIAAWEGGCGLLIISGGACSANLPLAAIGVAIGLAPWLRRTKSIGLLATGAITFWLLVIFQMALDATTGYLPIEHLLPIAAIGAATD